MKKSANGYFKFFNKDGIRCRIKCDSEIKGQIIIKFKEHDDISWMYHSPRGEFSNCLEAATYILKNLETDRMVFNIMPASRALVQSGDSNDF